MRLKNLNNSIINSFKPFFINLKYGLFLTLFFFSISAFAYKIRVEIENCPQYFIYLGVYKGPDFKVIDSLPPKNGVVEFKSDSKLAHGVYFIVIPPQSRFDFIIADEQNITIKTDANDILGKMQISGEKQYTIFNELQKEIAIINKKRTQLSMELEFYKSFSPDTVTVINKIIDSLNKSQSSLYSAYKLKTEKADFLYKILNVLEPFYVPTEISNMQYSDPLTHYNYYKAHYLDRVDFNDESLLNTPEFIFHKLLSDYCFYFFDTRINKPDEVYPDIDSLISKTDLNNEYRQYILNYLISRYENPTDLRLEAYLVYIYRNYFMTKKPDWVSDVAYSVMQFKIESIQYNVIGDIAKDLNLPDINGNYFSIYNIDSDYKVLLFWEPDCDICNETALILSGYYPKLKEINTEIYAVLSGTETQEWTAFISENEMDWINVYDPSQTSNFSKYYGTYKTPRLYILNRNNKILAKDIKPEFVFDYIQN
ncbi:MAG: redoxin domain-containing protein, partial [Bacteroidales bacterium]|nr:redoxin domain-containing protein [Bacteroidales bacterium]